MARNKKHINDKFYTNIDAVKNLLKLIDISQYDLIIEPSAGDGAFSNQIPNIVALDIDPEHDSIIKMDWFEYKRPDGFKRLLIIGNPPFGNQGGLALKFIKKCIDIQADTIAFILPKSFKKDSIKAKIPLNYHLVSELDISDDSFLLNGVPYKVPCVFQIWDKKDSNRVEVKHDIKTSLFNFVKKSEPHDLAFRRVGFYAGRIFDDTKDKSEQSHYFIKSNIDIEELKSIFNNIKWEHNNTAGPRSIGKRELIGKL